LPWRRGESASVDALLVRQLRRTLKRESRTEVFLVVVLSHAGTTEHPAANRRRLRSLSRSGRIVQRGGDALGSRVGVAEDLLQERIAVGLACLVLVDRALNQFWMSVISWLPWPCCCVMSRCVCWIGTL
jgi:hypothetical protein